MAIEDALWIRQKAMEHQKWFEESIPLIASENVMSPLAKEMIITDLNNRYARGCHITGTIRETRSMTKLK
jgi:Glycine/serine hydroxymethyltransferase